MAKVTDSGLFGGVAPVAPVGHFTMLTEYIKADQNLVSCATQDVVYGAGYFELDKNRLSFRSLTSAPASGSTGFMMRAPMRLPSSENSTAHCPLLYADRTKMDRRNSRWNHRSVPLLYRISNRNAASRARRQPQGF